MEPHPATHASPRPWPRFVRLLQPNLRLPDAAGLDPERLMQAVADHGANVVLLNGGGMVAWYPTRLPYQRQPPDLAVDYLGRALAEAQRLGLKALARIDATKTYQEFFADHPDWFRKGAEGSPVAVGPFYETCMNGPFWQEKSFEIAAEILDSYPADGIFYNSFLYRACLAPCPSCDPALRALAAELGVAVDAPDVRYAWMARFAERLRAFVEARRPGATVSMDMEVLGDNPGHSREAGWSRKLWSVQVPVVAIAFNRLTRPHPIWPHQAGENGRYPRATLADRPNVVLLTYSGIFGNRRVAQPPAQLAHDLVQAAANGAGVGVQLPGTFDQDDRRALPDLRQTFLYLAANEDVYGRARSVARVALVYSQLTADAYAQRDPAGWLLEEYRGWYRALSESHVFFDVVDDAFLEEGDLDRYATLILPNVAALSDAACARLDGFVEAGGHLVATFETSLFRPDGRAREDFGLASLGRRYERSISAPGSYLSIRDRALVPGLEGTDVVGLGAESPYGGFGPLAFDPPVPVARGPVQEAAFVFTTTVRGTDRQTELFWVPPVLNNIPEFSYLEQPSNTPGLIAGSHGRGRVTYLSWMAGRVTYRLSEPGVAAFLASLAKPEPAPVQVEAPAAIQATLHRLEPDGWLLHLLNPTGLSTPTRAALPAGPVRVLLDRRPGEVRSLWTGARLEAAEAADGWTVRLESVDLFEALVISAR